MSSSSRLSRVLASALAVALLATSALATVTTVTSSPTLQSALNAAHAGDRILMAPGTYTGSIYTTNPGGTAASPIIIAAQDPLNPPVFDLVASRGGIMTDGMSNYVWDGMILKVADIVSGNGFQATFGTNVVFKNFKSVQSAGASNGSCALKFTGCTNFLMYNCTVDRWADYGVNMVGSAKGLLMNNTMVNTANATNANCFATFEAKGGSYNIGMYNNMIKDGGARVLQMGGDTGTAYFHQGNLALGWENYDCIAMGNTLVNGKWPINYSNANNVRFDYNTVVNPVNAFLRILSESSAATNPSSNGTYSHNLVQYASVGETVNGGGANTNPASFTFDGNYWYKSSNPSASIPSLVGTQINNVGGTNPQLDANYDPQYAPAKAYGADAASKNAAWLAQVNKFQWAWDAAQAYVPHANAGGTYVAGTGQSVALNATASTGGAGSYGSFAITSYQWDLNNDGVYDLTGSQPSVTWLDLHSTYGLPFGSDTVGLKITSINELNQTLTSTSSAQITLLPGAAGDANGDHVVSFKDYIVLEANFGKSNATWAMGDFNGDGTVNFKDYVILEANFGQSVPEPTTLALLGLAAMLLRRKN